MAAKKRKKAAAGYQYKAPSAAEVRAAKKWVKDNMPKAARRGGKKGKKRVNKSKPSKFQNFLMREGRNAVKKVPAWKNVKISELK